jgi:8-oxo-dGTP pyrophosphatase MutT (NUDIX family)
MRVKILSKKRVLKRKWIEVFDVKVRGPDGSTAIWQVPEMKDAVAIVPIEGDDVYLVKEWRAAWEKDVLQIPAGGCPYNTESGRIKQVRNELREELGLVPKKIVKLGSMMAAARIKGRHHIYLVTDFSKVERKPNTHEYVRTIKMPFKKALDVFISGKEESPAYTLVGMLLAKEKLKSRNQK